MKFISIINNVEQKNKCKDESKVNNTFQSSHYVIMKNSIVSPDSKIGDYTYIGYNCVITKSTIGRYCSIANNVSIGLGEHKIKRVSTSSLFYSKPYETLTEKECIIGNDVWLGQNVVIRRGVIVGDGAIVGANSFVNKNIKPFSIVAGSPAKFIAERFNTEQIALIRESEWWVCDIETAKQIIQRLTVSGLFEDDLSGVK